MRAHSYDHKVKMDYRTNPTMDDSRPSEHTTLSSLLEDIRSSHRDEIAPRANMLVNRSPDGHVNQFFKSELHVPAPTSRRTVECQTEDTCLTDTYSEEEERQAFNHPDLWQCIAKAYSKGSTYTRTAPDSRCQPSSSPPVDGSASSSVKRKGVLRRFFGSRAGKE